MNELHELYRKRDAFWEFGSEVPEALTSQIVKVEKETLQKELLPIVEELLPRSLPPCGIDEKVLVAMEYENRTLTRIGITGDVGMIRGFYVIKELNFAEEEQTDEFVAQMPSATFSDVCNFFPRELQGSYGVVRTIEEIKLRKRQNKTEESRWFLEPKEILTAADGVRFAVSNEWGDNFVLFQNHVTEQLGWSLEEVD